MFSIDYSKVGSRILEKREEKHLSQSELAAQLSNIINSSDNNSETSLKEKNISYRTIGNWESGRTTKAISLEYLQALCEVLECDFHYLLGESDYETKELELCTQLTELSKESCSKLLNEIRTSLCEKEILDSILKDELFTELLLQIHIYRSSYSRKILITDDADLYKDELVTDRATVSTYVKRSSVELFERILDHLYEKEKPSIVASVVSNLITKLLNYVWEFHMQYQTNDRQLRPKLKRKVEDIQNEIKKHDAQSIFANMDSDFIIDNIYKLYNSTPEDLE